MGAASLPRRLWWDAFVLWHVRKERHLPFRPLEEILAWQGRRVRAMVEHAYRHVPFYCVEMRRLGLRPADFRTAADLARLPVVDSRLLADNPEDFRAGDFASRPGLEIESSGTSGRSKRLRYDARALFLALVHGHRQRIVYSAFTGRLFGYREVDLMRTGGVSTQIRRFYEAHSWIPSRIDLKRGTVPPGDASFPDTVATLNELRPDVIISYGSYVGAFLREVVRAGAKLHHPRLVVYGADEMAEADRRLIEAELHIPVISIYQAAEALRIGFQCELRRGFHLSLDAVAVRVVDERGAEVRPGGTGHLVISNLTNRATVLLNYRLGDVVTVGREACPCGRTLPTIEGIRGRADDLLRLGDGRMMHGSVALEPLRAAPGVQQVQIVQRGADRFLLRAVPRPAASPTQNTAALVAAFRARVGQGVMVDVEWVDAIQPGPNGKVSAVISEILRPGEDA